MPRQHVLTLLALLGLWASAGGCHHLTYQERVWNGWCDSGCGDSNGGKGGAGRRHLFAKLDAYTHCANGCGEYYHGEWISDPPDCCDPCDAYYGCWTGGADCCHHRVIDPVLWLLKWHHRDCAPWWAGRDHPCSGCYYVDCPYSYGCHPMVCPARQYGCACGCEGCGAGTGDDAPEPDGGGSPHEVEEIPAPTLSAAPSRDRVAEQPEMQETTNLLR